MLTYEVHEYLPGRFAWHVYETDPATGADDLVDWWNKNTTVEDVPTGKFLADGTPEVEPTMMVNGDKIDLALFRTEKDAHAHCVGLGAKCRTIWTGGHPDPEIAQLTK